MANTARNANRTLTILGKCLGHMSRRRFSDLLLFVVTKAWAEANAMVVRSRGAATRFSQA